MQIIQEETLFSDSLIWKLQNEAYTSFGPDAWKKKGVPFYLTAHPLTASQFAQLAIAHVEECIQKGDHIELFDLGAGSGRFGALFLLYFDPLFKEKFPDSSYSYTMTDFVEENLNTLKSHPYLEKWVQKGVLSFSKYSFETPIREKPFNCPPILLATYFFDTIPQMLYKVKNKKIYEGYLTLSHETPEKVSITDLVCTFSYKPMKKPPTPLLLKYAEQFEEATFLIPTGAYTVLEQFERLSKGHFFLLTADQGRATHEQIRTWGNPTISRHSTFSIAVNYDALSHFFLERGGFATLPQNPHPLFITAAMGLGSSGAYVKKVFHQEVDPLQVIDYWKMTNLDENALNNLSFSQLLELIKIGNYDPINFYLFFPYLLKKAEKNHSLLPEILAGVKKHLFPVSSNDKEVLDQIRRLETL